MPRVGITGQTYLNTGSYENPQWERATILHDLTVGSETTAIAVKNKGVNVVRYMEGLREVPLDFECDWEPGHPVFDALLNSHWTSEVLDLLILDGRLTKEGSQGLRAGFIATKFERGEPLDDAMTASASLKLAAEWEHDPEWVMVGAGGTITTIYDCEP